MTDPADHVLQELKARNAQLERELADRKKAEALLEESHALSSTIFQSTADLICILDLDGRVEEMNDNGRVAAGGLHITALRGRTLPELSEPGSELWRLMPDLIREAREKRVGRCSIRNTGHDGVPRWWHIQVTPICDDQEKPVKLLSITREITEDKNKEHLLAEAKAALEKALAEAERANRAKEDFLAMLSHELRTPLNPVLLLASENEKNAALPAAVRADFGSIRKNVELEAQLIDDLLDITRISRGKMRLTRTSMDLHQVITSTCHLLRQDCNDKQITLAEHYAATPIWIEGDAVRVQQIIWNILKNAIRFTPPQGMITLRTELPSQHRAIVSITDTGAGIEPEDLERIFSAFDQGTHGHKASGLGLGLAITKALTQLHGGSIRAESAGHGHGATFSIELPPIAPPEKPTGPLKVEPIKSEACHRVLLIEDHDDTRFVLERLLKLRGYEVNTAASLAEVRALLGSYAFDIFLSDLDLPDGHGYDIIGELQAACPQALGIALSGHGMEEDVRRSLAAGFACHITKPVKMQILSEAMQELSRQLSDRPAS